MVVMGKSSILRNMFRFLDVEYDESMVDSILAVSRSLQIDDAKCRTVSAVKIHRPQDIATI